MESVINEVGTADQRVSIRTDVKLNKQDVKQIVSELPKNARGDHLPKSAH